MALIRCSFASAVLMRDCTMHVFVPEKPHSDGKSGFPVIYLLHGRSDDENAYVRYGIYRYLRGRECIVVMPDGARSFYTDKVSGEKYWTFVSEELPRLIQTMFPARAGRDQTFAAGLSMGGYGALKLGLRHPERFGKIAALSAVTEIGWVGRPEGNMEDAEVAAIFGSRTGMLGTDNDLFELLRRFAPGAIRPELWMRCGSDDVLIEYNREFRTRIAAASGWRLDYSETPGAGHNWDFWLSQFSAMLDFIENKNKRN